MANETVSLDSLGGNVQPNKVTIDLTKGGSINQETPKPVEKINVVTGGVSSASMDGMKPVDIHSIAPKKPEVNEFENSLFADLDAAVSREKASITERIEGIMEKQQEEQEAEEESKAVAQNNESTVNVTNYEARDFSDDDLNLYDKDKDEDDDAPVNIISVFSSTPVDEVKKDTDTVEDTNHPNNVDKDPIVPTIREVETVPSAIEKDLDDDIFKEDNLEDTPETTDDLEQDTNSMIENLRVEVKDKLSPISKIIDISKFKIAQKAVSINKAMKLAVKTHQNVADWVMFSAKKPISVSGLSGPEIIKLNPENTSRNRLNTFRDMYHIIYDHIYDGNKPEFEAWLKQVKFIDVPHIYFALYMATFGGSNFVNYSCPKCNKVFIKDVKFEDMVQYADEKTKEQVRLLLAKDSTSSSNDEYPVDLVQISDNYVFALHTPSIYSVIIETASLADNFLEKYSDLIDLVVYIDAIYLIDHETQTLNQIDTKPDPNDQPKTSARRIKAFYDIIRTLNTEEYYKLRAAIRTYDDDSNKITYKVPACECPECKTQIPENVMGPDELLFTRHQLAALGSM